MGNFSRNRRILFDNAYEHMDFDLTLVLQYEPLYILFSIFSEVAFLLALNFILGMGFKWGFNKFRGIIILKNVCLKVGCNSIKNLSQVLCSQT